MNFTALELDIARPEPQSICRAGLVCIENSKIVYQTDQLVKPPKNAYSFKQTGLHDQHPQDTALAPLWPEVWSQIRVYIEDRLIISPKAAFTLDCLFHAQQYYMLPQPVFNFECIYCMTDMELKEACRKHTISCAEHAGPLARALATARLYMYVHENQQIPLTECRMNTP